MEKKFQFFKMIIERNINYVQILFTDESKISMDYYTHDFIRLDPEEQKKLKNGERDVYTLLNRPEHKFQKSMVVAGGVSFFGTTNLIILEGTMNLFTYG